MGRGVESVNDIEILQDMLSFAVRVPLQQEGQNKPSVQLIDDQAATAVEIKGLPYDSIVIRAEDFENPLTIFNGSKGERKRADFVIVSNEEQGKWIICIETQAGNDKSEGHIIAQLKGAQCFIGYCKCIGISFWESVEFLDGYQYRFVSMANINSNKVTKKTRPYSPHIQSKGELHDTPDDFLKFLQSPSLYFRKLLHEVS